MTQNLETGVNVKIEERADKDEICTLTIEELSLNSSAVYFCAAQLHSATYHCYTVQKPHHTLFSSYTCSQIRNICVSSSGSLLRSSYCTETLVCYRKLKQAICIFRRVGRTMTPPTS